MQVYCIIMSNYERRNKMYLEMSLQLNQFIQTLDKPYKAIVLLLIYVILPLLCFIYIVLDNIKTKA